MNTRDVRAVLAILAQVCKHDWKSRELSNSPIRSARSLSSPPLFAFRTRLVNLGPLLRVSVADIQFDSLNRNRIFACSPSFPFLSLSPTNGEWKRRKGCSFGVRGMAVALRRLIAARDAHLHFKSHARTKICTRAPFCERGFKRVQHRPLERLRNVQTNG